MPLFYFPPFKRQYLFLKIEWIVLLLGLLMLLATTWIVHQFAPKHQRFVLPDWAVAQAQRYQAQPNI